MLEAIANLALMLAILGAAVLFVWVNVKYDPYHPKNGDHDEDR